MRPLTSLGPEPVLDHVPGDLLGVALDVVDVVAVPATRQHPCCDRAKEIRHLLEVAVISARHGHQHRLGGCPDTLEHPVGPDHNKRLSLTDPAR